MAKAVLATLAEGIDSGAVRKVISVLPRELRTLWPEEATRGVVM